MNGELYILTTFEQLINQLPTFLSQITTIFFISLVAIFVLRRDLIIILVAVELMLLASILNFALSAVLFETAMVEVFILYILVIAAAETSIVLAIFVIYYNMGINDGEE